MKRILGDFLPYGDRQVKSHCRLVCGEVLDYSQPLPVVLEWYYSEEDSKLHFLWQVPPGKITLRFYINGVRVNTVRFETIHDFWLELETNLPVQPGQVICVSYTIINLVAEEVAACGTVFSTVIPLGGM